jgi:hypothetical protein
MKTTFTFFALFFTFIGGGMRVSAQNSCPNLGFSSGDFTNWTGSVGENDGTTTGLGYTAMVAMIIGTPNSSPYTTGQETIMNQPGTDPNTQNLLSVVPPGGTSSCRLGNAQVEACDNSNYPQAAQLEYTISVSNENAMFTCQYAVVLQNPNHTASEQPRFTMYVLDSAGTRIDSSCGQYIVTAASGIPGFTTCAPSSSACESDNVEWKNWTSIGVDLSSYIGQNITIQFTAFDCTPGGHFGYAYISCACNARQLTEQCTGTSEILSAPSGFASYSWSPGGDSTQSITINSPVNGTVYSCTCTSPPGCQFVVADTLNYQPVVFTANSPTICDGETTTLTATGNGYTYYWNTNQSGSSISVSPTSTTIYTVTASATSGCSNSTQATVNVNPLPQAPTITQQEDSLISSVTNGNQWYEAGSIIPGAITQYYIPVVSGNYYTIVTDGNGCSSDTSNNINIIITGINDLSNKLMVNTFPSPVSNMLSIETSEKAQTEIMNMEGQLMRSFYVNKGNTTIDVSSFSSGIYIIEVKSEYGIAVKKIVKE